MFSVAPREAMLSAYTLWLILIKSFSSSLSDLTLHIFKRFLMTSKAEAGRSVA